MLESQLTKLKSKLIVLENSDSQKKQYEKKNEEMASRLREVEKALGNARREINHYQVCFHDDDVKGVFLGQKLSDKIYV